MLRATLDTSVLMEYWKEQDKATVVEALVQRAREGVLDLAVSARLREDVPCPPLAERINELPLLSVQEIGAVTRLDHWVLDRDVLGSDCFVVVSENPPMAEPRKGGKPPDWRDWDHLHAHYLSGRDVFLTWDTGMLALAEGLREKVGITVMRPEEFLARSESATGPGEEQR